MTLDAEDLVQHMDGKTWHASFKTSLVNTAT